jgi:general secretion pathway protein A
VRRGGARRSFLLDDVPELFSFGGAMYEAFYGLREKPFNLTPDPRFLYLSEKHKEAFAHLLFGIKNRSGFIMVSGEIGTGKTTICRSLLGQLDEDVEIAFIFNPWLSPEELLRKINEDFGIHSRAATVKGLIDELNAYLLDRNAKGKNCVLVIDEAQDLAPSVLEQIRLLSNLETETEKLLQIVLIGQPELGHKLQLDELRQLNQRITARYHLKPLSRAETLQYIAYRIRVAGGRRKVRFARGAIRSIYRHSGGTPRVINAICDRALLIGYTRETRDISPAIVRRAAKEIRGERMKRKGKSVLRRLLPNPTLVAAALLIVLAGKFLAEPLADKLAILAEATLSAPTPSALPVDRSPQGDPAVENEPSSSVVVAAERAQPPEMEAPEPVEKAGPVLEPVLRELDPNAARNAAALSILYCWNLALVSGYPRGDSVQDLSQFTEDHGLTHTAIFPTLDQLIALDLPAFVKLKIDDKALWVTLIGVENDRLRCSTVLGKTMLVPKQEFRESYLNQAVVPWRDPDATTAVLKAGMRGDAVRSLQLRMGELDRFTADPTGVYDDLTVESIRRLQSETGLNPDGMAGRQIRMVLTSWHPDFRTPSLKEVKAESPAETVVAEKKEEAPTSDEGAPVPETATSPESKPEAKDASSVVAAEPETPAEPAEPQVDVAGAIEDAKKSGSSGQDVPAAAPADASVVESEVATAVAQDQTKPLVESVDLAPIDEDLALQGLLDTLVLSEIGDFSATIPGKQTTAPTFTGVPLVSHKEEAPKKEGGGSS